MWDLLLSDTGVSENILNAINEIFENGEATQLTDELLQAHINETEAYHWAQAAETAGTILPD